MRYGQRCDDVWGFPQVHGFYDIEKNRYEMAGVVTLIFNVTSFPFNVSEEGWSLDKQDRVEFAAPVNDGVILNLKSHLAASLAKFFLEDMAACNIFIEKIKAPKKIICGMLNFLIQNYVRNLNLHCYQE